MLIVLDGAGCGELPDAAAYRDAGSDTLGHVADYAAARGGLRVPTLDRLGLFRVLGRAGSGVGPIGAWGRMAERSAGKDSVTGHWEMMGLVLPHPFPTFPQGFPQDLIEALEARIGRPVLGNVVASGTAIIDELGPAHLATGHPIVYTSADSVLQIAAHESVIPVPALYDICHAAFDLAVRGRGVGRVIARPFVGVPGAFQRTANRHDFAMPPTDVTLLDRLTSRGIPVVAVGKVGDLFAGRGVLRNRPTTRDEQGMDLVLEEMGSLESGLVFANLVDFDTVYGHRNDVEGYARNLERFDVRLQQVLDALRDDDLLIVTADHGNDPTTPSTDHSREYVPVLACGARVPPDVRLGVRPTFADLGQTLAENFAVDPLPSGTSFLEALRVDPA